MVVEPKPLMVLQKFDFKVLLICEIKAKEF